MSNQLVSVKEHAGKPSNNIIFSDIEKYGDDLNGATLNALNLSGDSCRICHCEGDVNALISPCKCTGSLKFVHTACLQQWLTTSKSRSCELCKFRFPHLKSQAIRRLRNHEISIWLHFIICLHILLGGCVVTSIFVISVHEFNRDHGGFDAIPFWIQIITISSGFWFSAYMLWYQYKCQCNCFNQQDVENNGMNYMYNAPMNLVPVRGGHPSGPKIIEILDNNVEGNRRQPGLIPDGRRNVNKLVICHVYVNQKSNIIYKY
ncbi:PREDICTED: E3 ubiquitin-protein ligase MARCH8-like [Nicrophorus vespilloides]|uniref:E3 ubiquitin-protein ligase MARCH8-like n=1 Tax=Nicrophorus vespilloides TaxID=110193 RepID=A0ABM1MXR9_NICVS|nr:PREDICTED: E3 ubiquitin-protein ligase MARCH8-like [Nicrophorus vespilloides]